MGSVWFGVDAFPTIWWSGAGCGGWEKRPGLENRSAGEDGDEIKECKAATRKDAVASEPERECDLMQRMRQERKSWFRWFLEDFRAAPADARLVDSECGS